MFMQKKPPSTYPNLSVNFANDKLRKLALLVIGTFLSQPRLERYRDRVQTDGNSGPSAPGKESLALGFLMDL